MNIKVDLEKNNIVTILNNSQVDYMKDYLEAIDKNLSEVEYLLIKERNKIFDSLIRKFIFKRKLTQIEEFLYYIEHISYLSLSLKEILMRAKNK